MPLNIVEPNLSNVRRELHELYVKDAKSGKYHLDLSDLETHVAARVSPIEKLLKLTQKNERNLTLSVALHQAGIDPHYEELVIANIKNRVAIGIEDGTQVIRITEADGGKPMIGSGADGFATLGDLISETARLFPSMFKSTALPAGKGETSEPRNAGNKTLTRSAFDKLPPVERAKRMSEGYRLVDDQADVRSANRPPPKPGEKIMTSIEFGKLSTIARSDKILKEGFKVVD
ncbi:hypothetical protein ABIF90_000166 [Bradyrhizobium japonicum]